uniref:Uncharacterized protein n=1 Tax=Anguilla anguilla TaxID=7936 RepID=A0A0E9VGR2_ANGAN
MSAESNLTPRGSQCLWVSAFTFIQLPIKALKTRCMDSLANLSQSMT